MCWNSWWEEFKINTVAPLTEDAIKGDYRKHKLRNVQCQKTKHQIQYLGTEFPLTSMGVRCLNTSLDQTFRKANFKAWFSVVLQFLQTLQHLWRASPSKECLGDSSHICLAWKQPSSSQRKQTGPDKYMKKTPPFMTLFRCHCLASLEPFNSVNI